MGNQMTQSLYICSNTLKNFQYCDRPQYTYFWIDTKIQSKENNSYLQKFKVQNTIIPYSNPVQFWKGVQMINQLRVICAASLEDREYDAMQQCDKIDRIMLFCGNKTRASNLMRSFPKIKIACYKSYTEVLRELKQWSRQSTRSIFFVEEHSIGELHQAASNCSMLTNQAFVPPRDQNYENYCKNVVGRASKEASSEIERIKTSKELVQNLLSKSVLFDDMNRLLQSTNDPTKLAYILWPVSQLSKHIKQNYMAGAGGSARKCFMMASFSEMEKRRFEAGRYFYCGQFWKTAEKKPEQKPNNVMIVVQIRVNESGELTNGYLVRNQMVLFNIGNYYKIQSFDRVSNQLVISLVAPSRTYKVVEEDKVSRCLLSYYRLSHMAVMKQGQWYPLMLSKNNREAEMYLKKVRSIEEKGEAEVKHKVVRAITNYLLGNAAIEEVLKELDLLLKQKKCKQDQEEQMAFAVLLMMLLQGKKQIFLKTYQKVAQLIDKIKLFKSSMEVQILKIALQTLNDQLNQVTIKNKVSILAGYEKNQIKDQGNYASDWYWFTLLTLAACHHLVGQFKEEMEVLQKLVWVLGWTQGREGCFFRKVNQMKKGVYERMNQQQAQSDLQKKNAMVKSSVPLATLAERDGLLPIDFGNVNFDLYD